MKARAIDNDVPINLRSLAVSLSVLLGVVHLFLAVTDLI